MEFIIGVAAAALLILICLIGYVKAPPDTAYKQTLDAQFRAKADAERYAAQQAVEAELFHRTKEAEAKMIERQHEAEGIRGRW